MAVWFERLQGELLVGYFFVDYFFVDYLYADHFFRFRRGVTMLRRFWSQDDRKMGGRK